MSKFTTRKFEGDDCYSWAVFYKADLPKGHRGIAFYHDARPVVSGMSRSSAQHAAKRLNAEKKA